MRVSPEDYQSPTLVAQIYDDLDRPDSARSARERGIVLAERHLALNPEDVRAVYMAANAMVALGQRQRGIQWADRALAMRPEDAMVLYNVGCIYSLAGSTDSAISCLEKAYRNGLTQKGWYEHDSNLDPLRQNSRFQELLRAMA
jgi:adenylate cyclase